MYKIPLSVPSIKGNEWKYVKECLDTEWVSSSGKYVDLFEKKIAEYTKSNFAVACVNGTSALHLSLRLAGLLPEDEVIVPTLTFIAPVNAIKYNNATPIFIDADNYYNIDVEKTIDFIKNETLYKNGYSYNKKTHKRIHSIIVVHVWGNACWLDNLVDLCKKRNIAIIEDASESLGTYYKEGNFKKQHTGTIGKFGCISFNGNKIITSGGGGMIITDDEKLADKAKYLSTQAKDDSVRYKHNNIGYNFRLTNIQAALGLAQLEQLGNFIERKKSIYDKYRENIKQIDGFKLADVPLYAHNNHWMNVIQIDNNENYNNREALMENFEKNSIQTRPVWGLNHLQSPYKGCQTYRIEKAIELVEKSLCLPSSTNINDESIKKVVKCMISGI